MKTAIMIPTYNRPLMVERLLKNLARCIFPPDVQIYIVENGHPSGTENVCAVNTVGDRVKYLYSPNSGKTSALNFAINIGKGDFIIFFDDDITVTLNIIETYVEAAQRYGPGHFFGGPLLADAEAPCPPHLVRYLPGSAVGWSFAGRETEIEQSQFGTFVGDNWAAFSGANWAVFRSDLAKSGLYAEDLGPSPAERTPAGGETELQLRLNESGVRAIYLPDAVISHYVSKECYTMKWVWHRHFRYGMFDYVWSQNHGQQRRELFGIPLWVIRSYTQQELKVLASRLLCYPIERRVEVQVRQAYLGGWLYAAWTRGKT
jgi:GT2 family glycosyltransferase